MTNETTRKISHGQVDICTQAFGDPVDPAVLLIMGATVSMLGWPDGFCEGLAGQGLFVIRYDNRDTGRSTIGAPGRPAYTTDDMAKDALAVLDGYGIRRAHVAGMSLGGMIAQLVVLMAPDRVLSLAAISSSAFDDDDKSSPIDPAFMAHFSALEALDWSDRAAVVAFQVESSRLSANADDRFDSAAAAEVAGREFDRALNPRSAMNHGRLGGGEAWAGRLAEIAVPAVVIHGVRDPILPIAAGRRLAAALPDARLVELAGGHELNQADWPRIIAEIVALTQRVR